MRPALIVALLFAFACDDEPPATPPVSPPQPERPLPTPTEDDPPADDEVTPTSEEPPRDPGAHFATGPCEAAEPFSLGPLPTRRGSIAAAYDSVRGGLVARTRDDELLDVWPVAASGAPAEESVAVALPGARDVAGIHRIGSRFVIRSHALCSDLRHMQKCLHLRALEADGTAAAPVLTEVTREWIAGGFYEIADDALVVLRAHTYIQPVLERYVVGGDGEISRELLADVSHEDEEVDGAPRAIGLAVDGEKWAAIVATESETSELYLHSHDAPRGARLPLPIVGSAARVELTFVAAGLRSIIIRTGRSPKVAVVGLDGTVVEPPGALPLSAPLEHNRVITVTAGGRDDMTFSRYDLARRPIAGDIPFSFNGPTAIDGDGLGYLLAYAGGPGPVRGVRAGSLTPIRCEMR